MRALIFVVIAAAVAGAGYFFYRQSAPAPGAPGEFFAEAPPPSAAAVAEDCTVANAVYEYGEDQRLQLRFQPISTDPDEIQVASFRGRQHGNMYFVVHATSFQADYRFTPVDSALDSGPRYLTVATYLRPENGGAQFQVSMFNSDMRYIDQMPRNDSVAPAYIYMPEVMRALYAQRIDLPPGAFRFRRCEAPAPAAAPQ